MAMLSQAGSAVLLDCAACGATNRVPVARLQARAVCGRCRGRLVVSEPLAVDDSTFDRLIELSGLPVLVDVWAPWCGPCRAVAPQIEKVAHQKQGELLVAKLNADESPAVAGRLRIVSIPSLLVFRQGREVRRESGAMPAEQILSLLGG